MSYLVIDTETSGLFNFKLPADDPSQPRLASLAMIWADDAGHETDRMMLYVKPEGWRMNDEATAVNGLTTEFLEEHGKPLDMVLGIYSRNVKAGLAVAAFNAQFDCKMMRGELRRAGMDDLFTVTRNTCLMRSLKPYAAQGLEVKGAGFVKLSVACEFFGIHSVNPHDAMSDAADARELLEILIRDGNLILPQVHFAKNRPAA